MKLKPLIMLTKELFRLSHMWKKLGLKKWGLSCSFETYCNWALEYHQSHLTLFLPIPIRALSRKGPQIQCFRLATCPVASFIRWVGPITIEPSSTTTTTLSLSWRIATFQDVSTSQFPLKLLSWGWPTYWHNLGFTKSLLPCTWIYHRATKNENVAVNLLYKAQ